MEINSFEIHQRVCFLGEIVKMPKSGPIKAWVTKEVGKYKIKMRKSKKNRTYDVWPKF